MNERFLSNGPDEIRPEIAKVLDKSVVGFIRPVLGGVITLVKDIVLATDGVTYICYHQSTFKDGAKAESPYYGFSELNSDDTAEVNVDAIIGALRT